jgi:uncharacterized membrane protein
VIDWKRLRHHLLTDHRAVARLFPRDALLRLETATRHGEQVHAGQVRLAIEASLPLSAVRRNLTPRARAIEVFGLLRVWDTPENCGVLVYLLLADRAVEIVADRGIAARVPPDAWRTICRKMEDEFRRGRFVEGAQQGIVEIGALLATHFPRRTGSARNAGDELPDAPAIL